MNLLIIYQLIKDLISKKIKEKNLILIMKSIIFCD